MLSCTYEVVAIDGDYAHLRRNDIEPEDNETKLVARALLPPETEVYPELENYPYSLFAKSRAFTRFQLLSSLPLNLKGMTIDLFDLNADTSFCHLCLDSCSNLH